MKSAVVRGIRPIKACFTQSKAKLSENRRQGSGQYTPTRFRGVFFNVAVLLLKIDVKRGAPSISIMCRSD
jgi:hypothetical protein